MAKTRTNRTPGPKPTNQKRSEYRMSEAQQQILEACSEKYGISKNQLLTMGFLHLACSLERLDADRPLLPQIATEFLGLKKELQGMGVELTPAEARAQALEVALEPEPIVPRYEPELVAQLVEPEVPREAVATVALVGPEAEPEPAPPPEPVPVAAPPAAFQAVAGAAPAAEFRPDLGKQMQDRAAQQRERVPAVDPYAAELHPAKRSWFSSSPPAPQESGVKGERQDGKESIIDFG